MLKNNVTASKINKSAKFAELSDKNLDSSINEFKLNRKDATDTSHVKFSRAETHVPKLGIADALVYNADTGCTDTMVKIQPSLESSSIIPRTPIYMADNTIINTTVIEPIVPPVPIPSIPGLTVPGILENLLSIGQLAYNRVTSVFTKDKIDFHKSPRMINGIKLGDGKRENKKYMVQPSTALPASTYPANLLT